jgi:hypothetical protein
MENLVLISSLNFVIAEVPFAADAARVHRVF